MAYRPDEPDGARRGARIGGVMLLAGTGIITKPYGRTVQRSRGESFLQGVSGYAFRPLSLGVRSRRSLSKLLYTALK